MTLNDDIKDGLGAASVSLGAVAKIVEMVAKDPKTATMPIGILWKQFGIVEQIPVVSSCLTVAFLSFWVGNAMVNFTEHYHMPLPLDMVGITRAASEAGVPVNAAVATLIRNKIAHSVGRSPSPEELKRVFGKQA
jgi:hypothetical protein